MLLFFLQNKPWIAEGLKKKYHLMQNNWIRKNLINQQSFLTIAIVFCELIWVISQHCNQVNFFRSHLQNVCVVRRYFVRRVGKKIKYVETIFTLR